MPYIANKKMNLAGTIYAKGDQVPDKVMHAIAEQRQKSLLRTRLIVTIEEEMPPASGDFCPHCDQGPFRRLAQHISMKHEDVLLAEVQEEEE